MLRASLVPLGLLLVWVSWVAGSVNAGEPTPGQIASKANRPPRKVIVATAMYGPYGKYPGLDERLNELSGIVDDMAQRAKQQYPGRRLDLAILPETTVTSTLGPARDRAIPLKGKVQETFSALARKHETYILMSLDMAEEGPKGPFCSNSAVLFDRRGEVVGIYRKAHPVAVVGTSELESGITPGREYPVFQCDFGKLGVQICWDIQFKEGWDALGRGGAEIVAWPTASPATVLPAARRSSIATSSSPAHGATTPPSMSPPEWSPRKSSRRSESSSTSLT